MLGWKVTPPWATAPPVRFFLRTTLRAGCGAAGATPSAAVEAAGAAAGACVPAACETKRGAPDGQEAYETKREQGRAGARVAYEAKRAAVGGHEAYETKRAAPVPGAANGCIGRNLQRTMLIDGCGKS